MTLIFDLTGASGARVSESSHESPSPLHSHFGWITPLGTKTNAMRIGLGAPGSEGEAKALRAAGVIA